MTLLWFISQRPTGVALQAINSDKKEEIEKTDTFIEWFTPEKDVPSESEIQAIIKRFEGKQFFYSASLHTSINIKDFM